MTDEPNPQPLDDEVEIVFRDGRTFRVAMLLETIVKLERVKKIPLDKLATKGISGVLALVTTAIQVECDPAITEEDVAHNLGMAAMNRLGQKLGELMAGGPVPLAQSNGVAAGATPESVLD